MTGLGVHVNKFEMSSSDSDSDEFYDAKDSWMSPARSVTETHGSLVYIFVLMLTTANTTTTTTSITTSTNTTNI